MLRNTEADTLQDGVFALPYKFADYGTSVSGLYGSAVSVIIGYKEANTTELYYSSETEKYTLYKNGSEVRDLISDKTAVYDNVFILYANATTYETEDACETVLSSMSGGKGVYCTGGESVNIKWTTDQNGEMIFTTEDGEILTVNRGKSYISFVKASIGNGVTIK